MAITEEYVDQIVRTVLREMQSRAAGPQSGTYSPNVSQNSSDVAADGLRIDQPVVTEAVLIAAEAAGRTITLLPGAILTPSGRDYVRKNSIRLSSSVAGTRVAGDVPAAGVPTSDSGLLIVVDDSATAMSSALAAGWKSLSVPNESAGAAKAAELALVRNVICFGGEASLIACLLNRDSAIRAAVIESATDIEALNRIMAPNVLCLSSLSWSFGSLLRLMRTWKRSSSGGIR